MINFDRLTNYSQEIISSASAEMNSHKNSQIEPEHILLAMVKDNGISRDYLDELKLINEKFGGALSTMVANFPTLSNMTNVQKLFL